MGGNEAIKCLPCSEVVENAPYKITCFFGTARRKRDFVEMLSLTADLLDGMLVFQRMAGRNVNVDESSAFCGVFLHINFPCSHSFLERDVCRMWGPEVNSPEVRQPGREANHLHPSSVEVKNATLSVLRFHSVVHS